MGMIALSAETEALAERLAAAQNLTVEAVVEQALKTQARLSGVEPVAKVRRRMTAEQMLEVGREVAVMPLLDHRTPEEIVEDLNAI